MRSIFQVIGDHNLAPRKKTRKKKFKKWTKPKGMPKRPLSAYNIFFSEQRQELINRKREMGFDGQASTKVKLGFANLARTIATKWKSLSAAERQPYTESAAREQDRYKSAVKAWQEMGLDPRVKSTTSKKKACKCHCPEDCEPLQIFPGDYNSAQAGCTSTSPSIIPSPGSSKSPFACLQIASNLFCSQESSYGLGPYAVDAEYPESFGDDAIEPLPIDYLLDTKTLTDCQHRDYKELSSKLFMELNHKLDSKEVGFLKSTFARSA